MRVFGPSIGGYNPWDQTINPGPTNSPELTSYIYGDTSLGAPGVPGVLGGYGGYVGDGPGVPGGYVGGGYPNAGGSEGIIRIIVEGLNSAPSQGFQPDPWRASNFMPSGPSFLPQMPPYRLY